MVGRALSLAEDEWVHRGALHEWWYLNSHLEDAKGRRFGAVAAFFPDYVLFGLADKTARSMVQSRVVRGAALDSSGSGVRFGQSFLVGAGRPGAYSLRWASEEVSMEMSLDSEKGPLLVGGEGKIREGLLGDSWYYSLTSLAAKGTLRVGGDTTPVSGIAWIDRQWGRWEDLGIAGWEWFSLQLSNGSEVLATQIYSPVNGRPCTNVLSVKRKDSTEVHSTSLSVRRLESLTSPSSGSTYGKRWAIVSPGVLSAEVEVDFDGQEFHRGFWEGSCTARGSLEGEAVTGVGYAEQVDRSLGPLTGALATAAAPAHYVLQNLLGRANLGIWDLTERLGVWRRLSLRR